MNYEDYIEAINNKEMFSLSRWGDGEWNCIAGHNGANCDGHKYFGGLGRRLRNILNSSPSYFLGLQSLAYRQRPVLIDEYAANNNIEWVKSDIFHHANIKGNLQPLLDALNTRKVILVGGNHLKNYNKDWEFIEIPRVNCWEGYEKALEDIENVIEKDKVVLFCASMMANVLVDDLHGEATLIDLGSVLDPYVGVKSRTYHHKLKI